MRRILIASLLSSVALTAAAAPTKPANDASTPTNVVVSTGVNPPQLVTPGALHVSSNDDLSSYPSPAEVVLKVNVDATGTTSHVEVVHSLTPDLDARVVRAVSQLRWRPAVLDNQTIPASVNLVVQVQH